MEFRQSSKLNEVCYEIRGPVIEHANALEEAGHSVLRLNTGNPALFGFEAPEEIVQDMIRMLPQAHGYSDSRGILSARRAVAQRYQAMGLTDVGVDDIFLGNGVSELISMSVQALLEDGDEVLIPSPDYPLWTAVVTLAGGKAVHYTCDEASDWNPDLADMASKITDRTKAVVIINPNNPTGAVYPREILEGILDLARRRRPVGPRRRDLRPDPVRRRRAPQCGGPRPRPGLPHLQRSVQDVPGGRVPLRLDGGVGSAAARRQLSGGPDHARLHAAVPERARPVRHSGRARRPAVHP